MCTRRSLAFFFFGTSILTGCAARRYQSWPRNQRREVWMNRASEIITTTFKVPSLFTQRSIKKAALVAHLAVLLFTTACTGYHRRPLVDRQLLRELDAIRLD